MLVYLFFDYLLGFAATWAAKHFTGFDIEIKWVSIQWGWTELSLVVGPLKWKNPAKYTETPFFLKVGRITLRLLPASVVAHVRGGLGPAAAPVDVDNFEVEGVALHLERNAKGLNLWAALGLSDEEGADLAEASKRRGEAEGANFDPDAFDDGGEGAEPLAPGASSASCPDAAADSAGAEEESGLRALGLFRVERVCVRGCRLNVDAFLKASKTKGEGTNFIKIQCLELVHGELRPGRRSGRGEKAGLYLDEVVNKVVWRVVDAVANSNKGALLKAAAGAAADQGVAAVKRASNATVKTTGAALLNATHTSAVKVNARLAAASPEAAARFAADRLEVTVLSGKHLRAKDRPKPTAYCKIQIGKKGVKAKTKVSTASNNPDWNETIALAPVESLDLDLRVQVYDRHLFHADAQTGGTLKIPLASLQPDVDVEDWFAIPPEDDAADPAAKDQAVKLKLRLVSSSSA